MWSFSEMDCVLCSYKMSGKLNVNVSIIHIKILLFKLNFYICLLFIELKKNITFIINPISGGKTKGRIPALISRYFNTDSYNTSIQITRSAEHTEELAKSSVEKGDDILVAVGGDGTINQLAKYVTGSKTNFGIVPMGSGNGLARHLNIPLSLKDALENIKKNKTATIDTGLANNVFFINVAGIGFDAHVSDQFSKAAMRGFISYSKITLREFASYKPEPIKLVIDGKEIDKEIFILCVANGSQYGNNAFIAPEADMGDGIFDISILKPFNPIALPIIGAQLFTRKFNSSSFTENFRGQHIKIIRKQAGIVNIDGEPVEMGPELNIEIKHSSLKIIIP